MRAIVLVAMTVLLAGCATTPASPPYSTLSVAGLRTGVIIGEPDCAREPSAVWVTAPHADGTVEGACIRYYASGLKASNAVAIVFLHGIASRGRGTRTAG